MTIANAGPKSPQKKTAEQPGATGPDDRFRKIFTHSNDLILIVDLTEDRIMDANPRACEKLGYTRDELLAMRMSDIHPDEMPALQAFAASVLKSGHGWTNELTCITKSGEGLPSEISASLIEVSGQKWMLALIRDISERRRLQEALRQSEERLSLIFESAMDAIVVIKADLTIALFNQAAEKAFLCRASEAIGQPLDRYLTEKSSQLLKSYLSDCQKGPRDKCYLWAREGIAGIRVDGKLFPVDGTVSQFETAGEKLYTLILRDINELVSAEEKLQRLQLEKGYLQEELRNEYNLGEIIGASPAMTAVFEGVERVAATDSTVLLTGETGTGKEMVARAIHDLGKRRERALVKLNCAALPSGLIESELFGHEKGAFTGATARKKGRFELADGGTIFLDEIGELPLETQTKLLRVLQEQEFERLGSSETLRVDVRVIAATNRNLQEEVDAGAFRADLYYRLNIFPIHIPPLRQRLEDIPLLADHFVRKFARRMGKRVEKIHPDAMARLMAYAWPGNVRELANILERALILCDGGVLQAGHVGVTPVAANTPANNSLEDVERDHILAVLRQTGWKVEGKLGAAQQLGLNPGTLRSRMKKLRISRPEKEAAG